MAKNCISNINSKYFGKKVFKYNIRIFYFKYVFKNEILPKSGSYTYVK